MEKSKFEPRERSEWLKQKSGKGLVRLSDEPEETPALDEKRVRDLKAEKPEVSGSIIIDPNAKGRLDSKHNAAKNQLREEREAEKRVENLRKTFK